MSITSRFPVILVVHKSCIALQAQSTGTALQSKIYMSGIEHKQTDVLNRVFQSLPQFFHFIIQISQKRKKKKKKDYCSSDLQSKRKCLQCVCLERAIPKAGKGMTILKILTCTIFRKRDKVCETTFSMKPCKL